MSTGLTGLGSPSATTNLDVTSRSPRVTPPGHYSFSGMLRSEGTKLRTVRSTMWSLALVGVISIGVSALATAETRSHWVPSDALGFDRHG